MRAPWLLSVLILSAAAPALAETAKFLSNAIKGYNSEMKLGELAARQGYGYKTRNFGAILQRDHAKSRALAAPLAARYKVGVPTALTHDAQAEYARLQHLHGSAFDHEFRRYMIADHQRGIADFEMEAASNDPDDVRALARMTLPTLHKHLATARAID